MPLQAIVDTVDAIPEALREFYAQGEDGKYAIQVDGAILERDHRGLISALDAERTLHSQARKDLKKFEGIDLNAIEELRRQVPELQKALEEASTGKKDAIEKAVEARTAPMARDYEERLRAVTAELVAERAKTTDLQGRWDRHRVEESLTAICRKRDVLPGCEIHVIRQAIADGWGLDDAGAFVAKTADGSPKYSRRIPTAVLGIDEYFDELQSNNAPLFKGVSGGGSTGSGNPSFVGMSRSKMTTLQKTEFVDKYGFDKFKELAE